MIVDSAAGDVSIVYGAKGPNYSITTAVLRLRTALAPHTNTSSWANATL